MIRDKPIARVVEVQAASNTTCQIVFRRVHTIPATCPSIDDQTVQFAAHAPHHVDRDLRQRPAAAVRGSAVAADVGEVPSLISSLAWAKHGTLTRTVC